MVGYRYLCNETGFGKLWVFTLHVLYTPGYQTFIFGKKNCAYYIQFFTVHQTMHEQMAVITTNFLNDNIK